jgi:hypothetical protein
MFTAIFVEWLGLETERNNDDKSDTSDIVYVQSAMDAYTIAESDALGA